MMVKLHNLQAALCLRLLFPAELGEARMLYHLLSLPLSLNKSEGKSSLFPFSLLNITKHCFPIKSIVECFLNRQRAEYESLPTETSVWSVPHLPSFYIKHFKDFTKYTFIKSEYNTHVKYEYRHIHG